MKYIFLYKGVIGFKKLYDYGYKHILITKEAKTRKNTRFLETIWIRSNKICLQSETHRISYLA